MTQNKNRSQQWESVWEFPFLALAPLCPSVAAIVLTAWSDSLDCFGLVHRRKGTSSFRETSSLPGELQNFLNMGILRKNSWPLTHNSRWLFSYCFPGGASSKESTCKAGDVREAL